MGAAALRAVLERNLRPTWVEVDLDVLAANVRELVRVAGGSQVMAVVKADGYGHGAVPVARTAVEAGARWLAVACLEEGLQLRRQGLKVPILILGYLPPEEARAAVEADISCCVFGDEGARALAQAAARSGRRARVHVKVDTGMGRLGVRPEDAVGFVRWLKGIPALEVEGVFTHLAAADEDDLSSARAQVEAFSSVLTALEREQVHVPYRHAANSAALLRLPGARLNLVRPGLAMYGIYPAPGLESVARVRPVLTWKTRVAQVKVMRPGETVGYGRTWRAAGGEVVGTLPVGYADGYRRVLSGRAEVLVRGRRAPIAGRVSMDQLTVALPAGWELSAGEEVVLLGRQGEEEITAGDLARAAGTIPYEILVGIGRRVARAYLCDGEVARVETGTAEFAGRGEGNG